MDCSMPIYLDQYMPWHTPFPIWNQSVVPSPVLTVASWCTYRFLRRQVRWSGISIFWRIFHSFWWSTHGFGVVNKAEDVFLEFSQFFLDPMDIGNLISGSSGFSKSRLNIWEFLVHILLKPSLENFEHYFASMWNGVQLCGSLNILWLCLSWDWDENWPFFSPVATAKFSKFACILNVALSQHRL